MKQKPAKQETQKNQSRPRSRDLARRYAELCKLRREVRIDGDRRPAGELHAGLEALVSFGSDLDGRRPRTSADLRLLLEVRILTGQSSSAKEVSAGPSG